MSDTAKQLEDLAAKTRIPGATYRLQFNRDFTFDHALEAASYLEELGVTDVYASPLFQAGPQSTHGYDICGFDRFSRDIGGREGFDRFAARLRETGLGLLLDMVPNHMGNDLSNNWWNDVLEHGRASRFALYFDIDWRPLNSDLIDQVLLPTLGDHYGKVLESGQLKLSITKGAFGVAYFDRQFPVAYECYPDLLEQLAAAIGKDKRDSALQSELGALAKELRQEADAELRAKNLSNAKSRLDSWSQSSQAFAAGLKSLLDSFIGSQAEPRSFDRLHSLLQRQHYRLAFWRVGPEEINYRRFFDVTELVSLRMELPAVFQASHSLVLELLAKGMITGLRIDHPDGLWDPKEYFLRLQAGYAGACLRNHGESAIASWLRERLAGSECEAARLPIAQGLEHSAQAPRSDPLATKAARSSWPLFVVAEKILSNGEPLRSDWPVFGTTGYDFMSRLNGIFVNRESSSAFDRIYGDVSAQPDFETTVYLGKRRILSESLASELNALTYRLKRVSGLSRASQDFTLQQLRTALLEVIATFPVYRTYTSAGSAAVVPMERAWIERAISKAKERNHRLESVVLDYLQDMLLLRFPADLDEKAVEMAREFILKFQQLTGPATAKGVEDTAFYNYNRLVSLNEVGGDPGRFGFTVEEFHQHNLHKAERWPHSMLATATHDTKRGEDTRARINTLSELPEQWAAAVERWRRMNANSKTTVHDSPAPHPNDEYLLYQTLVGAWPITGADKEVESQFSEFRDRVEAYMLKAMKEAKGRTSWTDPDSGYEKATSSFVRKILSRDTSGAFLDDFTEFQRTTAHFGIFNSLSQVLLKLASPGVPDFYQGTELWDLSLVDPDNRRPVDYALRRRCLAQLRKEREASGAEPGRFLNDLLGRSRTGEIKLFTTDRGLGCRRRNLGLFKEGDYIPLAARGPQQQHICAFARTMGGQAALVFAPRLIATLMRKQLLPPIGEAVWQDTKVVCPASLEAGNYRDVFTGEEFEISSTGSPRDLPLSQVLGMFPVAMLEKVS
jgi:(1->4)-alpha-D-glucan 1-alpha-D-glucosylmutase